METYSIELLGDVSLLAVQHADLLLQLLASHLAQLQGLVQACNMIRQTSLRCLHLKSKVNI